MFFLPEPSLLFFKDFTNTGFGIINVEKEQLFAVDVLCVDHALILFN